MTDKNSSPTSVTHKKKIRTLVPFAFLQKHRTRFLGIISIGAVLLGTFIYFLLVSGASAMRHAYTWPALTPDEEARCRIAFRENSLTPHADVKFAMYREYSRAFLLETAKTMMYRSDLLKNSECLSARVASVARHYEPIILVFYDTNTKQAVLVIRNYDRSETEALSRRIP